jgi:hypothetical protein
VRSYKPRGGASQLGQEASEHVANTACTHSVHDACDARGVMSGSNCQHAPALAMLAPHSESAGVTPGLHDVGLSSSTSSCPARVSISTESIGLADNRNIARSQLIENLGQLGSPIVEGAARPYRTSARRPRVQQRRDALDQASTRCRGEMFECVMSIVEAERVAMCVPVVGTCLTSVSGTTSDARRKLAHTFPIPA